MQPVARHGDTPGDESRAAASGTDGRGTTVDAIDAARAAEYLLLATLLKRAPSAALLETIGKLRGDASPLGMAHLALAEAARRATPESVAKEFFDLFIGIGRGEILPFGSYYLTGFLHDRPLALVREDMHRLGVERREGVFEPEDHIASLLEVVAGLAGGGLGHAPEAADAFFATHVKPWAGRLMADIEATPRAGFYKAVGAYGRTWIEIEAEALGLPQ